MGITFGNQPCVEPNSAYESCVRLGLSASWYGLPNQFSNPLGCRPGVGHILLTRAALDALDLDAAHDLVMRLGKPEVGGRGYATAVTHKSLHVVLARNLTPGLRADKNACYLVTLADRRRLLRPIPIDKAYNVRSTPSGATYFSATLNTGSLWTWATMLSDIWSAVGTANLGTYPGLGFTPDGTPECFAFHGWYALDALEVVLDRVGCALKLDTQTDVFSIVRIGASDTQAAAALAADDELRVLDSEFVEPDAARYPQYVRVLFPRHRAAADTTGGSPYYSVDTADPSGTPAGVRSGTYAVVYDDLPATYNAAGTLTNAAALATRAAERTADHYRRLRLDRRERVYGLPLPEFSPGSQIKAVRHGDRGRGLVTQLGTFPGMAEGNPFPGMSGGSSGGLSVSGGDGYGVYVGGASSSESSVWHHGGYSPWVRGGDSHWLSIYQNPAQLFQMMQAYLAYYICCCHGPVQALSTGSNQDNYALTDGTSTLFITASADFNLTGLARASGNTSGDTVTIYVSESSTGTPTLKHNVTSTAANRISTPGGVDQPIAIGTSLTLVYDGTTSLWTVQQPAPPKPYSPGSITGSYNNYTIPYGTFSFVPTLTGDSTFTGMAQIPKGMPFAIVNATTNSNTLTLSHLSGSSSAANQFDLSGAANVTLDPGESLLVINTGAKLVDLGASLALSAAAAPTSEGTLAATGSVQGDAAAIVTTSVEVTGADGTKGVILPNTPGAIIAVYNSDAIWQIKVYPHSGAQIGSAGTNVAINHSPGDVRVYVRVSSTLWHWRFFNNT